MKTVLAACILALQLSQDPARAPEPDEAAQKDRLKLVRDLFKDEYARRTPADQKALARRLLEKGLETKDDAPTRYVLLKESRDLGAAAGDVETCLEACDRLGESFTVDVVAMKSGILSKLAPAARDAESQRLLARGFLAVAVDAVRSDSYAAALAAAGKAEAAAKAAQDVGLLARAQEVKKDLGVLKDDYTKIKGLLEKGEAGEPEAVGRYLCFVKDDWDGGLMALMRAKGSPLSALAEMDLGDPKEADKEVAVGDGWWDLAQKEKVAWKKKRQLGRARLWYERALSVATGLTQVRLQKRVAEIEETAQAGVGLLALVDLKQDVVAGDFKLESAALKVPSSGEFPRLQFPYAPPAEYDLSFVVERLDGTNSLNFGLVAGGGQCMLILDGGKTGETSGLEMIDGKNFGMNETTSPGRRLPAGAPTSVMISVRKGSIAVSVAGKPAIDWKGDLKRMSVWTPWQVPRKDAIFVGSSGSGFKISRVLLTPISGPGRRVR